MNDKKTSDLLEEKAQVYGDVVDTHTRIADVWTGILGHTVTAQQAALMMAGLKLVRASKAPAHVDSYDDAHGYVTIAQEITEAT